MADKAWHPATDGSKVPEETVVERIRALGWSRDKAQRTPVRKYTSGDEDPIAVSARLDELEPRDVQKLMRDYEVAYEDARDYLFGLKSKKGNRMSLKDSLKSFIDNTGLAEVFGRKSTDTKALRAPLLKGIANARRQFDTGTTKAPNRWWKVGNGVVALTVKIKGDTLDINGAPTNHIPEDRFPDFLDAFQKAVETGEFDAELKNHGRGEAEVDVAKPSRKSSAKVSAGGAEATGAQENIIIVGGKTGRGSISPEAAKLRGQKAAASRKANKAKLANA